MKIRHVDHRGEHAPVLVIDEDRHPVDQPRAALNQQHRPGQRTAVTFDGTLDDRPLPRELTIILAEDRLVPGTRVDETRLVTDRDHDVAQVPSLTVDLLEQGVDLDRIDRGVPHHEIRGHPVRQIEHRVEFAIGAGAQLGGIRQSSGVPGRSAFRRPVGQQNFTHHEYRQHHPQGRPVGKRARQRGVVQGHHDPVEPARRQTPPGQHGGRTQPAHATTPRRQRARGRPFRRRRAVTDIRPL